MALSDNEIRSEIEKNNLIENYDPNLIEGACYQLRFGDVYYDLSEGGKRIKINADQAALIKPGHQVVLITMEELNIPSHLLSTIVSKGSLFSIGLSPVATFADPGFSGNLGIVTHNISDKYIEIPKGEPIAKAQFSLLSSPASKTYKGQHGFQAGIWPIKTHLQKKYNDIKDDSRVDSEKSEALALLPSAVKTIIKRVEITQLYTIVALVIATIINSSVLFLIGNKLIDSIIGVVGNLVSSVIVGAAAVIVNFSRRTG